MCRSIHTLYNLDPPVTQEDINQAALQFVRKVSGYRRPSKANDAAFTTAVSEITTATIKMLATLETSAPLRARKPIVDIRNE
jgi:hypothetical protein